MSKSVVTGVGVRQVPGNRQNSILHLADHVAVALAFGLVTALIEVLVVVYRWVVQDTFAWTGQGVFWMVPLYYGGLFLVLGSVTGLVSLGIQRLFRREPSLGLTAGTACALAAFALLFLIFGYSFATVALVLLSLGLGAQTGRWAGRNPPRAAGLMRRTALTAAVAIVLVAGAHVVIDRIQRSSAESAMPPAPAGAPNVLLIILDTVRAASFSLYGYDRPTTPGLEAWAGRGTVFERAIAPSSWTLPTHASIFTGKWPHLLSANWLTPLDERYPTLAERLRDSGYRTGGFVANLYYTTGESGLDRGFTTYRDYLTSPGQFRLSTALAQWIRQRHSRPGPSKRWHARKHGEMVTGEFLEWVARDTTRPFFAFLNYFDAHSRYRATPPWKERFAMEENDGHGRYDASIAYLDSEIDSLLSRLERTGNLEHTLVILTGDHGELFGEHGLEEHGNSLYDRSLHVPLILWYPGVIPEGGRIAATVSLRDLGSTIMDLAGLGDSSFPGTSLRHLWSGESPDTSAGTAYSEIRQGLNSPPNEPVSNGDMYSLYEGSLQYILNGDGTFELYDVAIDSGGLRNLAGDSTWRARAASMYESLVRVSSLPFPDQPPEASAK